MHKHADQINLGRAIRTLRTQAGLTQEQLSSRSGLSVTYVNQIENGKANPTINAIGRLLRAIGVGWKRLASELDPVERPSGLRE